MMWHTGLGHLIGWGLYFRSTWFFIEIFCRTSLQCQHLTNWFVRENLKLRKSSYQGCGRPGQLGKFKLKGSRELIGSVQTPMFLRPILTKEHSAWRPRGGPHHGFFRLGSILFLSEATIANVFVIIWWIQGGWYHGVCYHDEWLHTPCFSEGDISVSNGPRN